MLRMAAEKKLLSGKTGGVDSTLLEANAAMKSIVRRDTGEDWKAYAKRLMIEEGAIEPDDKPTDEELRRFDKNRKNKRTSNDEWVAPHDPGSRIAKMKDGRTHLAYKAEHVVDLKSDMILAAQIYRADQADTQTLVDSVMEAVENTKQAGSETKIKDVAADGSSENRPGVIGNDPGTRAEVDLHLFAAVVSILRNGQGCGADELRHVAAHAPVVHRGAVLGEQVPADSVGRKVPLRVRQDRRVKFTADALANGRNRLTYQVSRPAGQGTACRSVYSVGGAPPAGSSGRLSLAARAMELLSVSQASGSGAVSETSSCVMGWRNSSSRACSAMARRR